MRRNIDSFPERNYMIETLESRKAGQRVQTLRIGNAKGSPVAGRSDVFSVKKRSEIMRAVKGANTGPELLLRRALFRLGFRYRLHGRLPGRPDLVFPARKSVIFVHGCFWHGHDCPRGQRAPKTNAEYWRRKIARNRVRDLETAAALKGLGWRRLALWECELKDMDRASRKAARWLLKALA
jgi:DNA mismatch endonuclease (patch repair protein)